MGAPAWQDVFAQHMRKAALDALQIGQRLDHRIFNFRNLRMANGSSGCVRKGLRGKHELSVMPMPSNRSEEAVL